MTEFISEREELAKLQKEYDIKTQQIAAIRKENSDLKRKLQFNTKDDLKNDKSIFAVSSDEDMEKTDSIM